MSLGKCAAVTVLAAGLLLLLLVGSAGGLMLLTTRVPQLAFQVDAGQLRAAAFRPDAGTLALAVSKDDNPRIEVRDVESGDLLRTEAAGLQGVTRLTVDATPSTAALMGGPVGEGEFDVFNPRNVAPLVAWLASDDAAGCNGEVFRVGGGTVWLMRGWHSVSKLSQRATWDPAALGERLKAELAKGLTAKENLASVTAEAISG